MLATVLLLGATGCTTDDAAPVASPVSTTPVRTAPPAASSPTPAPDEVEIPVDHDAGYADAVATFGLDRVRGALADDARIARIALADCVRWRSGTVDPQLTALVSPALLARVQEELGRPAGTVPSLLSNLPTDDGNGNDEAAAVRTGCDDTAPLRYDLGVHPIRVSVDRAGGSPQLVLDGEFAMNVTFGRTAVAADQRWTFSSTPVPSGWQLTDAETDGNVNWAPAMSY